jgi:HAD superfamily hydrolase (TIGR01549 family)
MPLRAVLFDLGGTLWDDWPMEREHFRFLAAALTRAGRPTTVDDFLRHVPAVVASYCPALTGGLLWRLCGAQPLAAEALTGLRAHMATLLEDSVTFAQLCPLRPGARELLASLQGRVRLAVASKHAPAMEHWLAYYDLRRYFDYCGFEQAGGPGKPDPRFIEAILEAVKVAPSDALMVGDRLDCDVWPANVLGLRTLRVPSTPWDQQQPRYQLDVPDYTAPDLATTRELLTCLLDAQSV